MYEVIREQLADTQTQLIAVSKTKPNEAILALYEQGQRVFGENYVQELVEKYDTLPKDIEWHLIGHLQTNKIKYIAPFVAMVHSVDSLKMLKELNAQAQKHERVIRCLLQFHIAQEATKFGFDLPEAVALLQSNAFQKFENIEVCGVMGMATFTDDKKQVKAEFQTLRQIFEQLKSKFFAQKPNFKEISMGMSDDYLLAITEGSTMVRIGSLLFGKRGG
jgi:PLP dependent protein